MADKKPNLLFIFTDQQRFDALGCAGGWVRTPAFDRIAAEGVRFDRCITNSPVCIPARLSMATGLYPHNTGVWRNCEHTMDPQTPTWMQAIRDAGYRNALFGKTHWHPHSGDLRDRADLLRAYGFDDFVEVTGPRASAKCRSDMTDAWEARGLWKAFQDDYAERFSNDRYVVRPSPLGAELYYDAFVGRAANEYLQGYDRPEPWMCWVCFPGPHEPWDTPEPYASMYRPEDMPAPAPAPGSIDDRPKGILDDRLAKAPLADRPEQIRRMRADYAGNVSLIDDQVGAILETIERRGEMDNTAIVLSSDHGEHNGDAGLSYKETFLDGPVRIPLLIRPPAGARLASGAVHSHPVELIDVGPTLADLAGAEMTHQQFGRSLCPALSDPEQTVRDAAISELGGEVMIQTDRYKGAVNRDGQMYLLIDFREDPGETTNLAGRPESAAVEKELRDRILEHLVRTQYRRDVR